MKINTIYKKYLILLIFVLNLVLGSVMLSSGVWNVNVSEENNTSIIKFAQVSDIHLDLKAREDWNKRLLIYSKQLLQDAIDQINGIKDIDFVVFSGDMINSPSESAFMTFIKMANTLKVPWYAAMGNHDIGIKSEFNKSRFLNILNQKNKNFKSNNPYYSFVPKKGFLVIVMDGVIGNKIIANGFFSKESLIWLEAQLKNNKDSKIIIIQHFPIIEPFKSSSHRVINAREYLEILNKYHNVLAVLSGHYHATKIIRLCNVIHVSTPALVEYPNAFRVITIKDKDNETELDFVFKETRLKNLQEKSKKRSKSYKLLYGEESDRNATVIIDKINRNSVDLRQ
ncbi:MAG: metallophosphoesterase [bacterium]